ncbi:diiron oxygenase [Nonomuraea sp. JJY05]|uniref:diiron oxygenase n=1 Tax=Nonomuraea sp. JJY05 TaxID=3350255 RepID=UPI00373F2171
MPTLEWTQEFTKAVGRLTEASVEDYYNPYRTFQWPPEIKPESLWMSRELLSVHGTAMEADIPPDQLVELSRWESVNLYSLIAHGIRELLIEVMRRMHTPGYEIPTPYFHHFIGEENEHMWFFAEFCLRYGGRIYPDRRMVFPAAERAPEVNNFIVFSQILIFEQIGDFFNARMAADASLPDTVREVNRIHHRDESRHIAFGGQLVSALFNHVKAGHSAEAVREVAGYLRRYIDLIISMLYSVDAYRDAGFDSPSRVRAAVLADPARQAVHERITERTVSFYRRIGLFD